MEIIKSSVAGTMESSDIQFRIRPGQGVTIYLESPVKHLFEEEIMFVIQNTLKRFSVEDVVVEAMDSGALDCTIQARLECALLRAAETTMPWEVIHD